MPYPTTCSTLTPAVPALPCNSALYSATDLKVPHCRESGQEHQLLTFRAKAIVMTAAHTAMPPKPTKWSVLRPARSTRNSWKCSRKKKNQWLSARTEEAPSSVDCTALIYPQVLSVSSDLSAVYQAALFNTFIQFLLLPFSSLFSLFPLKHSSPFTTSQRTDLFLLPPPIWWALCFYMPIISPLLCHSIASYL